MVDLTEKVRKTRSDVCAVGLEMKKMNTHLTVRSVDNSPADLGVMKTVKPGPFGDALGEAKESGWPVLTTRGGTRPR